MERVAHLCEHVDDFVVVEEVEHTRAQAVEVRRLSAHVDGTRVGFQSVEHACGECGRKVERR